MLVTLVTGSPGGGKDVLMTTLCSLCTQKSGWTVIKLPANSTNQFSPTALQASLKTSWTAFRRTFPSGGPNAMKLRVLVLVPDFTDTVDVVQAIMTHFDKDINSFIKISAVTACIDPSNVFMAHSFTFPTLLEQVAQGWVNNVVFRVTDASLKNEPLDRIQALIRAKNSNVALLLAPKGEVKRSNDLDLILAENSFNELELLRARYLSCPGWWLGEFDTAKPSVPHMENTVLTFSQPLDRERLLTRLKKLKKGLAAYPFNGNIYHLRGHIAFLDAPSDLFEFQYTVLSGKTSLVPSQPEPAANGDGAPQNFWVVFSGCQLQTEKLKDWLKNTAQPKPEKRVKRTRESLTKTEISRVHKQYHLAPLPEGWYYSGNMYVCMDGEKSNTHPCLENFLTEYLQQVNEDVDTYNTNIDAMNYKDLFE